MPPHGVVSGSAPWYPLGTYGQAQWHAATLAVEQQYLVGQKLSAKTDLSFLVIFSFSKLSTINRAKSAETTKVDERNFVRKI